jgi:hypothetical protein
MQLQVEESEGSMTGSICGRTGRGWGRWGVCECGAACRGWCGRCGIKEKKRDDVKVKATATTTARDSQGGRRRGSGWRRASRGASG